MSADQMHAHAAACVAAERAADREVMRQALEALKNVTDCGRRGIAFDIAAYTTHAITALTERLKGTQ